MCVAMYYLLSLDWTPSQNSQRYGFCEQVLTEIKKTVPAEHVVLALCKSLLDASGSMYCACM